MAVSKDLGLMGSGGAGVGDPQLAETAPPPSAIRRHFLYIMYKVESGAVALEGGVTGAGGNRY